MRHLVLVAWVVGLPVVAPGLARPAAAADAAADPTAPRTLADYLRLARAANESFQAASTQARAARERVGVARGYPDPRLIYGYYFDAEASGHEPSMKGRNELLLTQEIPFFGKRGLRGEVASSEAAMAERMSDALGDEVEFEVKINYYEFARLHQVSRVLDEEAVLLERMRAATQARYAAERAEQQDVLKVDLALSQIEDQMTLNRRELVSSKTRLNELIGRDPAAALPEPEWRVPRAEQLSDSAMMAAAMTRRPELRAAQAELARALSSRRLAGKEYIPDFMLGLKWEFGGQEDDFGNQMEDVWEVMAGVNLPLWPGKRRAMVRESEAMKSSAGHRLRAAQLRARRDVEEALARVRAADERRARFETVIIPQAEQTFQSSEAGYRAARVDFIDYLDSERMLLSLRKEYYEVVADLGRQIAALERAIALRSPAGVEP
jgi:outer membrane protein TolC